MRLSEFHYDLPAGRIAQEPVSPRDAARLMVVRSNAAGIEHARFLELDRFLGEGDVLVINTTRVFPARLRGRKDGGGKVELLLLEPADSPRRWRVLVRGLTHPGRVNLAGGRAAMLLERVDEGRWIVEFDGEDLGEYARDHGEMPLPPYIKREAPRRADVERYQTVYARREGAVAAPTAGFHFTESLLQRLRAAGVSVAEITLHVGWGTFRPVRTETVEEHRMLPERYEVDAGTAALLNEARSRGRRLIAVGTTTVRALETVADEAGRFREAEGETGLFIYPGYRFKAVDALITNFHLPDATPLLLASAFYAHKAGRPETFSLRPAYEEAIRRGYRFYSYGDAMLIL